MANRASKILMMAQQFQTVSNKAEFERRGQKISSQACHILRMEQQPQTVSKNPELERSVIKNQSRSSNSGLESLSAGKLEDIAAISSDASLTSFGVLLNDCINDETFVAKGGTSGSTEYHLDIEDIKMNVAYNSTPIWKKLSPRQTPLLHIQGDISSDPKHIMGYDVDL
nr:unnamed protein product [Callosobruchus analis]